MTGKTHLAVGILASVSLTALSLFPIEPSHALILMGGAAYGALLPDIDADYSIAKNKFLISSWIYRILANLFNRNGRKTCFVHRGLMHSLFIPLLYYIGYYFAESIVIKSLLFGVVIGLLSHLALDLISSGEELFAPVSQKRFCLPFAVKTGGVMDYVLRYASFVGILYIATYIILGDNPLQIIFLIVS